MSDIDKMIDSILEDIIYSLELIQRRSMNIETPDDFMKNEETLEKLDSISMRLLAIGEGFKNIDKLTSGNLLTKYPSIEWRGVKGMRDILSHHYFDINSEIIFDVCKNKLPELLKVSREIRESFGSTFDK